jgi:hypothetical protein
MARGRVVSAGGAKAGWKAAIAARISAFFRGFVR